MHEIEYKILLTIDRYAQEGYRFRTAHGGTGIQSKLGVYCSPDRYIYPFYLFCFNKDSTDRLALDIVRDEIGVNKEQYSSMSNSFYWNKSDKGFWSTTNPEWSTIGLNLRAYLDRSCLDGPRAHAPGVIYAP